MGEPQIYRDLLRFRPDGLSLNAWAVKAGVSRTVWADMRRHGNPSRRTLEKLLGAADTSLAEFEALRLGPEPAHPGGVGGARLGDGQRTWAPAPLPPLPLIASTLAGEWGEYGSPVELTEIRVGEVLERVPRPAGLAADPEAFALTIVGDSMWPRFSPGRRVAVSPRSPVAIGDDVLIRIRSGSAAQGGAQRVVIAQLVKRTGAALELRQFNPALTVQIPAEDVETVLKIPGELI